MAPRGTKRVAEVDAEVPAAKQLQDVLRQHGVAKTSYQGIEEAINHPLAPGLTEESRKMLVAMLPHSLLVQAGERTRLQEQAVTMLSDVFQGIMLEMQAEIDSEAGQLVSVQSSKAVLETAAKEAVAALAEASSAYTMRKGSLAEAAKAFLAAKALLADKEKEQRQGDAAHKQALREKDSLENALAEDFRLLRDGEVEAEEAKLHYDTLAGLASKLSFEESLLTALPASMLKKPSERGSFDAMVVAQLEEGLARQIAQLTETVKAGVPAAEARQAAVAAAIQQLESSRQVQQVGADELVAATEFKQQREKENEAALAALAGFEPEYQQAVEAREGKVEQLGNFKAWNLACFEQVRDRPVAAAKKQKTATQAEDAATGTGKELVLEASTFEVAEAGA
ncbi:unnamed protein product [Polarella glacialis]|uniref:Uncharacterized protein n=1 Tax=Polarella glacialis TaxID=89957 RepID=A0A813G6H1_POLGL|nr:unnamed protein product [Polarella glacialis]CAE8630237.1 unnamed protein product [Polarella glacialis]